MQFKKWEDLTITDDFLFCRLMHDEKVCRPLIESILGVKIGKIKFLTDQHEIRINPDSKTIVMDVFLTDYDKIINVELQTGHRLDLPKRARYYQAAADVKSSNPGLPYRDLKDNYVIFICTFDPFNQGLPIYYFENRCINDKSNFKLDDGTMKVFLNLSSNSVTDLDCNLKSFYSYVKDGKATSDYGQFLAQSVSSIKSKSAEREKYMHFSMVLAEEREEGFAEGLSQGKQEGISEGLQKKAQETAKNMLKEGISPEVIAKCTGLSIEEVKALQKSDS